MESRMPRRRYFRAKRRYFKRQSNRPTVARPYGSVYDNDYYQRIQYTGPLTLDASTTAYVQMRTDTGASTVNDLALFDQPEFNAIKNNFAFYSVVGMKLEISPQTYTSTASTSVNGATIWAGFGENVAQTGPSNPQRLESLSLQSQGSAAGQVTSLYYAYAKDLKKLGAQHMIGTQGVYAATNSGVVYAYCRTSNFAANDVVGEVKAIWYVQFHGRRSL